MLFILEGGGGCLCFSLITSLYDIHFNSPDKIISANYFFYKKMLKQSNKLTFLKKLKMSKISKVS
jgi:hypothetical protein